MSEHPYRQVDAMADVMREEMIRNAHKGDRWMECPPRDLLHEVTWHWAKLARVVADYEDAQERGGDPSPFAEPLREYAADVANGAMMLLDRLGMLRNDPSEYDRGREAGIRQAVRWLQADYQYGDMPEWRQSGVDWIEDRARDERVDATNGQEQAR